MTEFIYSSYSYNYRITSMEIIWDSNEVMIAYIDEPVMTFTDYLVFCGGLMGLWFGIIITDIITNVINAKIKPHLNDILFFIQIILANFEKIIKAIVFRFLNYQESNNFIVNKYFYTTQHSVITMLSN